ncbi:hypothetical protein C7M84_021174, partial [Penaeus vannamei]
ESLDCPVCFEQYDDNARVPKMMSCLHTVCVSCILDLLGLEGQHRGASEPEIPRGRKCNPRLTRYIVAHLRHLIRLGGLPNGETQHKTAAGTGTDRVKAMGVPVFPVKQQHPPRLAPAPPLPRRPTPPPPPRNPPPSPPLRTPPPQLEPRGVRRTSAPLPPSTAGEGERTPPAAGIVAKPPRPFPFGGPQKSPPPPAHPSRPLLSPPYPSPPSSCPPPPAYPSPTSSYPSPTFSNVLLPLPLTLPPTSSYPSQHFSYPSPTSSYPPPPAYPSPPPPPAYPPPSSSLPPLPLCAPPYPTPYPLPTSPPSVPPQNKQHPIYPTLSRFFDDSDDPRPRPLSVPTSPVVPSQGTVSPSAPPTVENLEEDLWCRTCDEPAKSFCTNHELIPLLKDDEVAWIEEFQKRKQQVEQDLALALQLTEVSLQDTPDSSSPATKSSVIVPVGRREGVWKGMASSKAKKIEVSKWTYDEIRHAINTSSDPLLVKECREEFHQRLRKYTAWKVSKNKTAT